MELTDPADPRVEVYSRLTDAALRRRQDTEHGIFLAESSQVVRRALAAGHAPRSFFLAHRYLDSLADVFAAHPGVPVFTGPDDLLQQVTGFHLHRGALAAMDRPAPRSVDEVLAGARRVAVLENVSDHTNLGAIFRSAAALGVDAVLVSPESADPLYRRSIRVSMGTVFSVPWARVGEADGRGRAAWPGELERLRAAGFTVAALELAQDSVPLDDPALRGHERLALVLGAEGPGVTPETLAACDLTVAIPMAAGVDSLNVAAASAVAFWELRPRG
ncbi:RNA methyltransferase [Citricoccus sp. SGAir0253]|uniref:TrmH family RNA methyltransferase n=1 Tax=Citricoccus sp. SGAir0253 TaxID=2567881 RepID=UPI0010CD02E3|nr:RNA methyltransferase [Citricoccus sp. SGAir0253]QCU79396.1 RNA methyltransferase [Citricoccus sp. SGAir0253]